MKIARVIQLVSAGAVATKMMSDTMENADRIGMPAVDIANVLGSKANREGYLAGHIVCGATFGALSKEKM